MVILRPPNGKEAHQRVDLPLAAGVGAVMDGSGVRSDGDDQNANRQGRSELKRMDGWKDVLPISISNRDFDEIKPAVDDVSLCLV